MGGITVQEMSSFVFTACSCVDRFPESNSCNFPVFVIQLVLDDYLLRRHVNIDDACFFLLAEILKMCGIFQCHDVKIETKLRRVRILGVVDFLPVDWSH